MKIETILSPLELPALAGRDLRGTTCVVFDILRATSTFVTALQNGAAAIIPVSEISEAVTIKNSEFGIRNSEFVLLAGERDGIRICAVQSGGTDFDFGNSPREFTPERVRGKTIVSTTTNGTRALQACASAKTVLAAAFLNLASTADFLRGEKEILLVCAGTGENAAAEDVLAAGALVELLVGSSRCDDRTAQRAVPTITDSSEIAWQTFARLQTDLASALGSSQNGRRLLALPELNADVAFCAQRDVFNLVARMDANGALRRV